MAVWPWLSKRLPAPGLESSTSIMVSSSLNLTTLLQCRIIGRYFVSVFLYQNGIYPYVISLICGLGRTRSLGYQENWAAILKILGTPALLTEMQILGKSKTSPLSGRYATLPLILKLFYQ